MNEILPEVRQVEWEKYRRQLEQLRREVFITEQGVPEEDEWDEFDGGALHFLASNHLNEPVGTVRLLLTGKITRMAVSRQWRGRGLGTSLLRTALATADTYSLGSLYLDAQITAVGFYRKAGFTEIGDVFWDAGIPHIRMRMEEP